MPDVVKFATEWPNYLYIATALVSGTMLILPALRRSGGSTVSPHEATLLINRQDALVLDLRSAEDFGKAHIINARNVPVSDLERRVGELQKHRTKPVIVCDEGLRSGAATLRKLGFEHVYTLSGGVAAWQQAGLPVEK